MDDPTARLYNIYLDFINPESRRIFGLYNSLDRPKHVDFLTELLNIAVFLCKEYCIVPPGVFLECGIAHEAMSRRSDFFYDRLVRMPIRERNIEDYIGRRRSEWSPFTFYYPDLFKTDYANLLRDNQRALVAKKSTAGKAIAHNFYHAPDLLGQGVNWFDALKTNEVEIVRRIPTELIENEEAITWPAFQNRLEKSGISENYALIRDALQHYYFKGTLQEFNLRILESLPYLRTSFELDKADLCYNYETIREALTALGIWKTIRSLSAESMCGLRAKYGYIIFRNLFDRVSLSASSSRAVANVFAQAYSNNRRAITETSLSNIKIKGNIQNGLLLTDNELDNISERLLVTSEWIDAHTLHQSASMGPLQKDLSINFNIEALKKTLSEMYTTNRRISQVWTQAGGKRSEITDGISPSETWYELLNKVNLGCMVTLQSLVDCAIAEYPNNPELLGFAVHLKSSVIR
ncbi:MAG: effector-associated domain EAD1-containing protein [Capsulimonas sp.]|uniref:effector-associated domain EAD1-containing protein n=1 Tax=Capsulimonas sp. TaxID=2494211 RepID=UPI0032640EDA